jgi:hypothetical protein
MASILDDVNSPAKILLIGKSGAGKTGALASLVASGYNLRIVDTDKGVRALRSLLTDSVHYKYAKLIKDRGIDLAQAVRYVPIDTKMRLRTVHTKVGDKTTSTTLLAPDDARAWTKVVDLMDKWKEGDVDLGAVRTWGPQDVLVLDSFSTLAKCAYYFSQSLNARLGARDQGRDYQRDVGEAQSQLTRLLELLYDSDITCNVVIISHITWVDESQGVASRPQEATLGKDEVLPTPDGYPSAIGRALSPHMGKYFNDVFISRSEGSGLSVRRTISTVPSDGVVAKNSAWLEREYPVTTGLAEIFAALRAQPVPQDLLDAFKRQPLAPAATPRSATGTTVDGAPVSNPVGPRPLASAQA